jgi:uncharacterized protein YciI
MTLINDYTYQVMTDQRERDLARLAEHNMQVRLALSGRESWWRRMLSRRGQRRIAVAAPRSDNRGMATPQHRVAH